MHPIDGHIIWLAILFACLIMNIITMSINVREGRLALVLLSLVAVVFCSISITLKIILISQSVVR